MSITVLFPWSHFYREELQCPCCGKIWPGLGLDPRYEEFFRKVEDIRTFVGHPVIVALGGGCRCLLYEHHYHPAILLSPHSVCAIDLTLRNAVEVDRTVAWIGTKYPELRIGWKQYRDAGEIFIHIDEAHRFVPPIPGIENDWIDGARW